MSFKSKLKSVAKKVKKAAQAVRGYASYTFKEKIRSKLITKASVLAKRANQRLREIEKQGLQSSSNAYKYVERAAFDGKFWTSKGIQKKSKGKIKFNTNFRSMTNKEIRESIRQLKQFESAKTSLTKGVRKKVETLTDKFNKKLTEFEGDEKVNEEAFQEIMSQNLTQELFKNFLASDVMELFAENPDYMKHSEEILQALVSREKRSLVEMSWSTIVNAYYEYHNTEEEKTTEDIYGDGLPFL